MKSRTTAIEKSAEFKVDLKAEKGYRALLGLVHGRSSKKTFDKRLAAFLKKFGETKAADRARKLRGAL